MNTHCLSLLYILMEITGAFFNLTNALMLVFGRHCFRETFQTVCDYNLARVLEIQTRLDYLDLVRVTKLV